MDESNPPSPRPSVARRLTPRALFPALAAIVVCSVFAQGEPPTAALAFPEASVDVGEVYQFAVLEHRFEFTNTADREIRITGVQAGDSAAEVEPDSDRVAAGSRGSIRVRQPVGPRLGEAAFRFTVLTDDPVRPTQELVLNTFVQSAYDEELPFLDFGDVDRDRGKTLTFEMATREVDRLELVEVVRSPDFIEVASGERTGVAGENLSLNVNLKPSAPVGLYGGVLHLRTNVAHHPDYLIRFRASIFGDVVPGQSPLQLGVVRIGKPFTARLQLGSRSGQPFKVASITDTRGWLSAGAEPCEGGRGPADCWIVSVRQTPQRPGRLDGALEVQVDGETIPLAYTGLVAAPDATIRSLGQVDQGVSVDFDSSAGKQPGDRE